MPPILVTQHLLSNTTFTFSFLSPHIADGLSRMTALLLERMLYKHGFLITFITSTLKNRLFVVACVGITVLVCRCENTL